MRSILRGVVADIRNGDNVDVYLLIAAAFVFTILGVDLLLTSFPTDLAQHREHARSYLYIGHSMARTSQTSRAAIKQILTTNGAVRVVLLDPANDDLMRIVDHCSAGHGNPARLRKRILDSLDELAFLGSSCGGNLQLRVAAHPQQFNANLIDGGSPNGSIVLQFYEFRTHSEPSPIVHLDAKDGFWFEHFRAQCERIWDASTDWQPPTPGSAESASSTS